MQKKYRKLNERPTVFAQELTTEEVTLLQYIRKVAYCLYEPALEPLEPDQQSIGEGAAVPHAVAEAEQESAEDERDDQGLLHDSDSDGPII